MTSHSETRAGAAETAAALNEAADAGEDAADRISEAFETAGRSISSSLEAAARAGEVSFARMSEAILRDLARLAVREIVAPQVEGLAAGLGRVFDHVIGQRAEGGPVLSSAPYLVGERGPEVFTPSASGRIEPMAAPPVQVIIHAAPGADAADAVRRSERQIAASVARAVLAGRGAL
ncbi:phage tail tape measure protein [Alkalicaulis satelles]|uniref:Phage tail tape measure protein n=1 Tax=Alkalicaulis satelles TaxID=2609175 RepID=A0A5M6ZKC1_9PROT|nr:phage tail tape measure C-terminal domain-containing protein [Alkalicaulis satelles]KAA5805263.1 phage tail tape measure protein [Alkalicaulis satelles]